MCLNQSQFHNGLSHKFTWSFPMTVGHPNQAKAFTNHRESESLWCRFINAHHLYFFRQWVLNRLDSALCKKGKKNTIMHANLHALQSILNLNKVNVGYWPQRLQNFNCVCVGVKNYEVVFACCSRFSNGCE